MVVYPGNNLMWCWYTELVLAYVQCTKEHQKQRGCWKYCHKALILAQGVLQVLRGFTKDIADFNAAKDKILEYFWKELNICKHLQM